MQSALSFNQAEAFFSEKLQASFHCFGIVEGTFVFRDFAERLLYNEGWSIRPMRSHSFYNVGYTQNPCLNDYVFSRKPIRIAGTI